MRTGVRCIEVRLPLGKVTEVLCSWSARRERKRVSGPPAEDVISWVPLFWGNPVPDTNSELVKPGIGPGSFEMGGPRVKTRLPRKIFLFQGKKENS